MYIFLKKFFFRNFWKYYVFLFLVTGENQLPYFPGLTRGLVAVILYYDGRTSIVNSLRTLVQAREGRTFTLGLSEDLVSTATKFTDQLMAEGLTTKVLGNLILMYWQDSLYFEMPTHI